MKKVTASSAAIFLVCLLVGMRSESARPQSFIAKYSTPRTQEFAQFSQGMQRAQTLEQLAAALSQGISLSEQVTLTIAECGTVNAFYDPRNRLIVFCYELIEQGAEGIERDFSRISSPKEIGEIASGWMAFVFMHELGHALIHLLDLPVLGREEDAADQIAAFFLLHTGDTAPQGLAGALWFFRSKTIFYTRSHFSDEHSLGPQRQSNLACWAFGKDPSRYQHLLVGGYLTRERATRCGSEYQRLSSSVRRLLGSNVQLPAQ